MKMMTTGIRLGKEAELKAAEESGFQLFEVTLSRLDEVLEAEERAGQGPNRLKCVSVRAVGTTSDMLYRLLNRMDRIGIPYLLVETEQLVGTDGVRELLEGVAAAAAAANICICIENGYRMENGRYNRNGLSSGAEVAEFVDALNRKTKTSCFAAALNTGHANLFGCNIQVMIETLGDRLKIIHANDNDGIRDLHQMPFTFTTEKGVLRTDWHSFVRALNKIQYDGLLIFDVSGLLANTPAEVLPAMMRLIFAIAGEWRTKCLK